MCWVLGKLWEIKAPSGDGADVVARNLKKVKAQASRAIFNCRRCRLVPELATGQVALWLRNRRNRLDALWVPPHTVNAQDLGAVMANSASVEVYGPFQVVVDAIANLPGLTRRSVNDVGSELFVWPGWSATLRDDEVEGEPVLVVVDSFPDPDFAALKLFSLLDGMPYRAEVRAADDESLLAARAAASAV